MARKLSITVSGAVSLGSYEAGVLYEVLYAIGQHNRQPATAEGDKIYVDVLTGASAGGMSVCVAAQKLLYEADSLSDPYANPLYRAWVSDIDIEGLLDFQPGEPADCSILSSDLIETLSSRYLLSRYNSMPPASPRTHDAVAPKGGLQLGLALSNLNGIDYSRPTLAGGKFTYTGYQDQLQIALDASTDRKEIWTDIQQAAVSCGAFPFAFRTKDLTRDRAIYEVSRYFDPSGWKEARSRSFTYTDGGMFQNEPLGLAKNLVDLVDNHQSADCRAYLFVAPDPRASTANLDFCSKSANFKSLTGRLLQALLNQSRFHDWIEAEDVNAKIHLLNQRADALRDLVQNQTLDPAAIKAVTAPLLPLFFPGDAASLSEARTQLQKQFGSECQNLSTTSGPAAAEAWIDAVLLFELAAGLHDKDEMFIYTVTAKDTELAGSQLEAFLGFFDEDYRQHDYDLGRTKAQQFLANPAVTVPTSRAAPLPPIHYTPQPVRPINAALANTPISKAPLAKREKLREVLKNRVKLVLKETGLPVVVREPLELFIINRKISEFLGL